jgi:hypothetical protein
MSVAPTYKREETESPTVSWQPAVLHRDEKGDDLSDASTQQQPKLRVCPRW